jgi:hypothetical protein
MERRRVFKELNFTTETYLYVDVKILDQISLPNESYNLVIAYVLTELVPVLTVFILFPPTAILLY